ncbi:MAG: response regulator [Candidatus Omnitrophica bacterium]|nr:response regulator [Candidatus Omnitrophota bacterium]
MPQPQAERPILVVDDEGSSRKLAKLLLEQAGYRVLTSPNGEEGLLLAKVERPTIILLDVIMPNMNGYEVLRRLKGDPDTRQIPVIMVTAKGAEHDIATSFRMGAAVHLEKPYEVDVLLKNIVAVLVSRNGNATASQEDAA